MLQSHFSVTRGFDRIFITFLLLLLSAGDSTALGINCRGSGLCPRASWNNKFDASIIQVLRDFVWASPKSNSTTYQSGDHIICVSQNQPITVSPSFTGPPIDGISAGGSVSLSGSINEGGICLFPQGTSLTLEQIRPLTDAVLDHKCTTCGSVPIHFVDEGSNDPGAGILTFNYVAAPTCDRNCISDISAPSPPSSPSQGSSPSDSTGAAPPPAESSSSSAPSNSASVGAQQTQSSQSIDQGGSGGSETSSSAASSSSDDGSDSQSTTTTAAAASDSGPIISTVTEQVSTVTAVASNSPPNSAVSVVTVPASSAALTVTAVQGGGSGSSSGSSSSTPSPAPPKSRAGHCMEVVTGLKLMVVGICVILLSFPLL